MSKKVYAPDGRRLVFRVQSTTEPSPYIDGWAAGPYTGGFYAVLLAERMNDTVHPPPSCDAGLSDFWYALDETGRDPFVFGFRDLDQLTNWFMWPELMREYHEIACIGVYAVEEGAVVDGQFQTIFDHREAEQVCILPLYATEYNPVTGEHNAN